MIDKDPSWGQPRTCYWCRKQRYLMTTDKEAVCPVCDEAPDYIDHMARVSRVIRLNALYAPVRKRQAREAV